LKSNSLFSATAAGLPPLRHTTISCCGLFLEEGAKHYGTSSVYTNPFEGKKNHRYLRQKGKKKGTLIMIENHLSVFSLALALPLKINNKSDDTVPQGQSMLTNNLLTFSRIHFCLAQEVNQLYVLGNKITVA
jgi:hypothetical protein